MALTDVAVRNAKPKDKPYKLSDEKGLYLLVSQAGKYWRMDYRFNGKRKTLALGVYPDVPLAGRKIAKTDERIDGARDKRDQAREQIAAGIDPGEHRKARMAARTN